MVNTLSESHVKCTNSLFHFDRIYNVCKINQIWIKVPSTTFNPNTKQLLWLCFPKIVLKATVRLNGCIKHDHNWRSNYCFKQFQTENENSHFHPVFNDFKASVFCFDFTYSNIHIIPDTFFQIPASDLFAK